MLEHEGMVEVQHGIGTLVTRIEPEQLSDVYAVRMILAEATGPFISMPVADDSRELLVKCGNEFLALEQGDTIGFAETNIRYVLGLIDLCHNTTMCEMQRDLFFQTSRMWLLLLPSMPWDETTRAVRDECVEVVRRIDIGDPIGLGLAMRNHIFEGRQRLLRALPDN